jgi:hypothetical protein
MTVSFSLGLIGVPGAISGKFSVRKIATKLPYVKKTVKLYLDTPSHSAEHAGGVKDDITGLGNP